MPCKLLSCGHVSVQGPASGQLGDEEIPVHHSRVLVLIYVGPPQTRKLGAEGLY